MSQREQLERRIEAYLDGALDAEQTVAFERELVKPKVARAMEQALARRDVLSRDAGDGPPGPTAVAHIERSADDPGRAPQRRVNTKRSTTATSPRRSPSALDAALHGASWIVRGPAMAFTAPGAKAARAGLTSVRFALGPLLNHRPPARAAADKLVDNPPVRAATKAVALAAKARDVTERNPWLQLALRRILR